MAKYFISGGSGFLGVNLIRYLLDKGEEVVSYDVLPFDYPDAKDRITHIVGDIRDTGLTARSMQGCDIAVHTAAALPLYSSRDIMTTDVDGTRNMLSGAFSNGIKRFVHISSTAVYGIPDHHPLLENDKLEGVGPNGKAKILAEELCL